MAGQPSMPKNATVLIVRHGEKPGSGIGLTAAGRARALAYVQFFQELSPDDTTPLRIDYLFAAANSKDSCRPQLTMLPLAAALGLPIDDQIADGEYERLAAQIRHDRKYEESTLLVCWHHETALSLAHALGVERLALPESARWPCEPWQEEVYGWVLVLVSDASGEIDKTRTRCINQLLMYDDYGRDPPLGEPSEEASAC